MEEAQREGFIDVETVYDADGVLYFSLRQDEPVEEHVHEFLEAKSYEFYDRWPDDVPVNPWYDDCVNVRLKPTYRECYLELGILPKSMVYADIRYHVGGESARRLEPGWASWRQVWPVDAAAKLEPSGPSDTSGTPTTFDVSDVDTTNFPNYGCPEVLTTPNLCSRDRDVALAVSGLHWGGNMYVQYKNPPEDELELNRIKETMFPCYDRLGQCTYTATVTEKRIVDGVETLVDTTIQVRETKSTSGGVVIIPVKYGPVEMAQWADILDRFALSRGNTIGITGAELDSNGRLSYPPTLWPLSTLRPAREDDVGVVTSDIRETIGVWTTDAQRVADALPTLLPRLGIPVDAVGVVRTEWRGANIYSYNDEAESYAPQEPVTSPGWLGSDFSVSVPLQLVARNAAAVLVLGAVLLLVMRRRGRETA